MFIVDSRKMKPAAPLRKVRELAGTVSEAQLRGWVECIAKPRHFIAEAEQNRATAAWLEEMFGLMGFAVSRQGACGNIVALPQRERALSEVVLVGAHYDSVPLCPGADDNGSAVAAMLGCAAVCSAWRPTLPVVFVAFNREEDGLLGSKEFVQSHLPRAGFKVRCAHILEMVGYASSEPGSQRVPAGLPVTISERGDFLGLLSNSGSAAAMKFVLRHAGCYAPELPVLGLDVKLGVEKLFPVLARSDHAPFWAAKLPALMWTDTSEFRNANYHRATDMPETLNYGFLKQVTQLLSACVLLQADGE